MGKFQCPKCEYESDQWSVKRHIERKHKEPSVGRHQSKKHKMVKEEVEEYPLPIQNEEQPIDRDLMEDSIQVFKIYKLLQRMKNK